MTNLDQMENLPEGIRNSLSVLFWAQAHREQFAITTGSQDSDSFFVDEKYLYEVGTAERRVGGLGFKGQEGFRNRNSLKKYLKSAEGIGYIESGSTQYGKGYRIAQERREILERMFGGDK